MAWPWLARGALVLAVLLLVTLHVLPEPTLRATTGAVHPYDPRLNFLSELVRTQYGPLMTACFFVLALAGVAGTLAVRRAGLRRETWLVAGAACFLVLLGLFPTDLVELRADGLLCDLPDRIEPCTWVGRVHAPLSSFAIGLLGLVWISLARRGSEYRGVVRAGWWAGLAALGLVLASHLYLRHFAATERVWLGLMQRSLVLPALAWLWVLVGLGGRRA